MSAFLITLLKALLAVCGFAVVLVLLALILGYTIYKICGYDQPPADGSLGFDAADEDAEYDDPDWQTADQAAEPFSSEPEPQSAAWLPPAYIGKAFADPAIDSPNDHHGFLNVRHKPLNGSRVFDDAKPSQPCAD